MGQCSWKQIPYIEPVGFVYSYCWLIAFPVVNQYCYLRYSVDVGFPYMNLSRGGEGGCSEVNFGRENSTLKILEIEVQTRTANLITYYTFTSIIPSLLVGPFMGSYSDNRGRKPVLIAPLIGAAVEMGIILFVMYYELPLYFLYISGALNGFTGYFTSLWLAIMSYVADTVEKAKLSNRIAIINLFFFLAGTVSQLTSGLWIENLGFKVPLWFIFGLMILALLYTIFFVKESVHPKEMACYCELSSPKKMLQVLTKPRKHGRKNLILAIAISGIMAVVSAGTFSALMLFVLRSPLCWPPSILGYFMAYRLFAAGVGSVAGIYVFKKCFNEINIARIGIFFQAASFLLLGFSNKTWMVFLVPIVGLFSSVYQPVLLSIASRLVGSEEQGILFALSGSIASLSYLAGTSIFNTLYPLSLGFGFPGFIFVLSAGLSLIIMLFTRFFDVYPDTLNENNEASEAVDIPINDLEENEQLFHKDEKETEV